MERNNEDTYIDKGTTEQEEIENIDIRKCKFSTYGGDFIVRQLMEMLTEKEIETPQIQRHYVWTLKIASRFIESILLDLPIPSIFFAKNEEGKFIIIDGLQRLTCLYNYIVLGTVDKKVFRLSSSKDIHEEWRGKAFNELKDEDQRKLKNKLLHAIIVEQKEPTNFDGLFLIFERINTGGMQLNQQEIRNSLFQCTMNDLLLEMNNYPVWRSMFGQEIPNARMRDVEMVLRFLTLNEIDFSQSGPESLNLVSKMNDFMKNHRKQTKEELQKYQALFQNTVNAIAEQFGTDVFRTNIQTMQVSQKFYATVFDAVMLATAYAMQKTGALQKVENPADRLSALFTNAEFKSACSVHTTDLNVIKTRVTAACDSLYGLSL